MILHFSHIGLTDGRTFMIPFGSVTSEPALAAVKAAATGRGRALAPSGAKRGTINHSKGLAVACRRCVRYGAWVITTISCAATSPGLKYDSMEQYFCDSAAEWTDNPGNELRRADDRARPRRPAGQRRRR